MSCGTADQTAQHIASAFVGGHNTVTNHKGGGTDMVCNQTDGNVRCIILLIFHTCNGTDSVPDCLHGINIKYGIHILYNNCQSFQPHAGINILLGKLCIVAVSIVIKLGKYVVPDFHKSVAVAAYLAVRLSAAVLDASVIVNFRTGAAGTCTMLPEVIAVTVFIPVKSGNLLSGHADFLCPDIVCLIILTVNGRIQSVRVHAHNLC